MESRKRPQEFPDAQNESDKRLRPGKHIQYNIFPTTQSLFDYVIYIHNNRGYYQSDRVE